MRDKGEIFADLVHIAGENGLSLGILPLKYNDGRLKGDRLALRYELTIDEMNNVLAHELAHHYLHFDKGDIMNSEKHDEYEEEAERAARMLLDALRIRSG